MTGTTESAANEIAARLGVAADDVHNVADVSADEAERYDLLLLGSSTWGCGELQDDWYGFLDAIKSKDLTGRKVGLFGCGDSGSYPDTFCDAIGIIYDALQSAGCSFVGALAPEDYLALGSRACRDGRLLGLVIDENAPASNAGRMDTWCRLIETE